MVREVKDRLALDGITVSDGCGTNAEAIAGEVIESIDDFVGEPENRYQVTLADLYDDYIASNDAEGRPKPKKLWVFCRRRVLVRIC